MMRSKSRIASSLFLALRLALFAGAISAVTGLAVAEHQHGGSLDARTHGNEHGYRDGYRRGRLDVDRGARSNHRTDDYIRGERGYQTYMGGRDKFKDGYRHGYLTGYDDAYHRRPGRWNDIYGVENDGQPNQDPNQGKPYPNQQYPVYQDPNDDVYVDNHYGYRDVAYDIGYRDGLIKGREDVNHHRDFRLDRHDLYKDGTHGYRDHYGSKSAYRTQYRRGFTSGYQDVMGR